MEVGGPGQRAPEDLVGDASHLSVAGIRRHGGIAGAIESFTRTRVSMSSGSGHDARSKGNDTERHPADQPEGARLRLHENNDTARIPHAPVRGIHQ